MHDRKMLVVISMNTSPLIGLVGRVFANGPGDRPRHTKDFQNGT